VEGVLFPYGVEESYAAWGGAADEVCLLLFKDFMYFTCKL
jgi:hypothetical protein